MSAIANGIDLNDDAVSGDSENDIVDGVNVLELTIGVGACANETLIDSLNGRRVEPAEVLLHGSDDGGVGLDEGLEREIGGVDREKGEEGGNVLATGTVDGLDCEGGSDENEVEEDLDWLRKAAEILVGGTGRGGAGDEIAAVVEGLGLRLKGGDVAKSGGSSGDSLGSQTNEGGNEIARERGRGNVMDGVKEYSTGFEVIAEKSLTKTVIEGQGGNAVQDEKKEKVVKIDENVNPVGDNGTHSNKDVGLIKNVVDSCFWKGEAKPYTSHVQERLPDEIPVMEVRAVVTNDFSPRGDFNGGAHVSLGVSTTKFGNQPMEVDTLTETVDKQLKENIIRKGGMSEHIGLVVDLNTYLGNWKHEAGFSIEGSEAKDVSSDVGVSVSNCTVGNDACHVDLGVSNGNRDIMVEERMTNIEMPNEASKKKKVKLAVSNSGFSVNDLVWGKIRSHPWWPGQIFDPSDSSKKAMSYFKKNTFLIAYFGDGTFAWNEASQLKPFGAHFSHMEKQSNTEAFRHAVDCALDEISSRVEFALACPCLSEDLYANIKSQVIVNSGIQAKSRRRNVRDEYSSTASFEPAKLVNYIKEMARYPHGAVDRLEHVISQAQLLSHCHWKGYPQLPEFKLLGGLLDNDAAMPHSGKKKYTSEVMEGASKVEQQVTPGVGKSKSQSAPSRKRKHDSGESLSPGKKERSLSDLMAGNHTYFIKEENESEAKSENKLVSSLSLKKHKVVDDTVSDDSGVKNNRSPFSRGGAMKSPNSKQSFRVGDAIRRVVSQLNGSPPNLKYADALPEKTAVKKESKEKPAMVEKSQRKKVSPTDWSSPVEMLSQLCLVAAHPLEGFNSIRNVVSFFSDFRDSVCSDHTSLSNQVKSLEKKSGGKTRGKLLMTEATASSEQEYVKDSYWTDMIIEGNSEDQFLLDNQNEVGEILAETLTEEGMTPTIDSEAAPESSPSLVTIQKTAGGNPAVESEKPMGDIDENSSEELSPTALILKFTDLDSAPSITNLNKIFTRYGPLNESETEVLKKTNRAKVVFKRRSDAETAFSSAGKYSIFGPSLVSYRLKYLSSTRQKSPSPATKRSRKDAV